MIELNCPACGKQLRIPDEFRGQMGKCNGCGSLVLASDAPIFSDATIQPKAITEDETWTAEATPSHTAQPLSPNVAAAIDIAVSQRESVKAQWDLARAIRQQTATQRVGCGCLVVILTAPIWIPLCIFLFGLGASLGISSGGLAVLDRYFPAKSPEPKVTYVPVEVPVPAPVPVPSPATPPPPPPEPLSPTKAVYAEENLYHLDRQCSKITSTTKPMTLSVAIERFKQPCPVCAPDQPATPPPPAVVPAPVEVKETPAPLITPVLPKTPDEAIPARDEQVVHASTIDGKYHRLNCNRLPNASVSMSLSAAQAKGMTACAVCKPPR